MFAIVRNRRGVIAAVEPSDDAVHRRLHLVHARIPLPAELFRGPYDERYGGLDGQIRRLFQGEALAALPEKE